MTSRLVAGSLLALSATGCLATKGDIRLLQDELRATRASAARADSAHRRTSDSLVTAIASLAAIQASAARDLKASQTRSENELKALSARVSTNDVNTKEQLKALGDDLEQVRERARQNTLSSAFARAQAEQANRQPSPTLPDSTTPSIPAASTTPGPATLLVNGKSLILNGSCSAARRSFQEVLTQFPDSPDAPEAQFLIAESYVSCGEGGSPAKADSVYKLVTDKYPRSDWAPTSLYKRAEALRAAAKPDEAKPLYTRIVCEFPRSTVAAQAQSRLGARPTCRP
jgi:TolA-binding protein